MSRSEQDGVGGSESLDGGAPIIDVERRETESARARGLASARLGVPLDGEAPRAARAQHFAQQPEPLGEARADEHLLGRCLHSTGAGHVFRHRGAELGTAARIGVTQRVIGRRRQRAARGREPPRAREGRKVGGAGAQVVARFASGWLTGRERRLGRIRSLRNARPRPLARRQPSLRDELAVRLGDRVPRDPQVGGQRPRGRQAAAGAQPAARDGFAKRRFERRSDPRSGQIEVQVDAENGPCFLHQIGA